ncbi:hypothetical protein Bca4012_074393 [Brassica carinata]
MSDLPPYPALDPIPPPTTSSSSAPEFPNPSSPPPLPPPAAQFSTSIPTPSTAPTPHPSPSPISLPSSTLPSSAAVRQSRLPLRRSRQPIPILLRREIEFKSVDASFIGDSSGELRSVPDSRGAIFKDKSLTLVEKRQLMKFFKLTWLLLPRWRAMRGRLRLRRKIWRVRLLSSWLRCVCLPKSMRF